MRPGCQAGVLTGRHFQRTFRVMRTPLNMACPLLLLLFAATSAWAAPARARDMQSMAHRMILEELDVEDVPVVEVLALLLEESKRLDPAGLGINMLFMAPPAQVAEIRQRKVTLKLRRLSIARMIHYVCFYAGLQYRIEKPAVLVADRHHRMGRARVKTYRVEPGAFDAKPTRPPEKRFKLRSNDN